MSLRVILPVDSSIDLTSALANVVGSECEKITREWLF